MFQKINVTYNNICYCPHFKLLTLLQIINCYIIYIYIDTYGPREEYLFIYFILFNKKDMNNIIFIFIK